MAMCFSSSLARDLLFLGWLSNFNFMSFADSSQPERRPHRFPSSPFSFFPLLFLFVACPKRRHESRKSFFFFFSLFFQRGALDPTSLPEGRGRGRRRPRCPFFFPFFSFLPRKHERLASRHGENKPRWARTFLSLFPFSLSFLYPGTSDFLLPIFSRRREESFALFPFFLLPPLSFFDHDESP